MYHDVCSVLQGTDKIGSSKGVIHNKGNAMLVSNGGNALKVQYVGVGIAESLSINHLGIRLYGGFQSCKVVHINNSVSDALGC